MVCGRKGATNKKTKKTHHHHHHNNNKATQQVVPAKPQQKGAEHDHRAARVAVVLVDGAVGAEAADARADKVGAGERGDAADQVHDA